mgnify:CR=1 FL=1
MSILQDTGKYILLMKRVMVSPDRWRMFFRQFPKELEKLGLQSLPIVIIISIFIGAIMTIQTKLNTENPLLPAYSTGLVTRDTLLLEFSSTILCLILAGKIGSNIASEIGTMRITEQIDALEIMGVNSANYLILPKIVAFVVMMPFLVIFSMAVGLLGGYLVGVFFGCDYYSRLFVGNSVCIYSVLRVLFACKIIGFCFSDFIGRSLLWLLCQWRCARRR